MLSEDDLRAMVESPRVWDRSLYQSPLYPYQLEVVEALEQIVDDSLNLRITAPTVVTMMSRQSGKNETSARLEVRLMCKYASVPGDWNIIKGAPTFRPQLVVSMLRLERMLENPVTRSRYWKQWGYKYNIGNATTTFLSLEPSASRHGESATLLQEIDEGQQCNADIIAKDFAPMTLTTNAPTAMWGTAWDLDNPLERARERAREEQKRTGRKLLFEVPWEIAAEHNPAYGLQVEKQREILGADHPIFLTQYCLIPLAALGRLFEPGDLENMRGAHQRRYKPRDDEFIVAGVDLCGADENRPEDAITPDYRLRRDATVATVAACKWDPHTERPHLRILDHYFATGKHPLTAASELYTFLFDRWRCAKVVVDARGVGDAVAKLLEKRRPSQVESLKSSSAEVSRMGFNLMASAKTGRLKMYSDDGSAESREFWLQCEHCLRELTPGGNMRFYASNQKCLVNGVTRDVHDDFPKSLGYLVEAAEMHLYRMRNPGASEERPDFSPYAGFSR